MRLLLLDVNVMLVILAAAFNRLTVISSCWSHHAHIKPLVGVVGRRSHISSELWTRTIVRLNISNTSRWTSASSAESAEVVRTSIEYSSCHG